MCYKWIKDDADQEKWQRNDGSAWLAAFFVVVACVLIVYLLVISARTSADVGAGVVGGAEP